MSQCTEMYRRTISKVIWVGTGALDAILSQINKKNWKPVSLPVTSETRKLSIFQLRQRQGLRVTHPAISLQEGSKTGPGRRRKSSLLRGLGPQTYLILEQGWKPGDQSSPGYPPRTWRGRPWTSLTPHT